MRSTHLRTAIRTGDLAQSGRITTLILFCLVFATPLLAQAPGSPESDIIREITRLDAVWLGSLVTRDVAAVDSVLTEDFHGQVGERLVDKQAILDGIEASTTVDVTLERLEVAVFGELATAHAIRTATEQAPDGTRSTRRFAYTDVYRWDGRRWRSFTGQSAPLPPTS